MDRIDQLINAAKEGLTEDIEQILKENPELLQSINENGETPLMAAVYYGKQNVVQQLLAMGVAISLHEAVAVGELETVQYLVQEQNAFVSDYSYDGWTPLHLASFFGTYEIAEFLIDHGADIHAVSTNKQKNMPIHAAAAGRKIALVELLLENKADPNVKQEGGWTPLIQAVHNFDINMCKLLLSFGADPQISNDLGQSSLDLADEKEYDDIKEMLKLSFHDRM